MLTETMAPAKLTSALGAEMPGIDLRQVTADGAAAIRDALHAHGVLVFRDQHLTREEQLRFTATLGELHGHPVPEFLTGGPADPLSLVENDENKPPQDDSHFHVDYSFSTEIPDLAVLQAEVVPPFGGDTIWSSAGAAYDALSPRMKSFVAGLTATHEAGERFWFEMRRTIGEDATARARDHFGGNSHPVVCAHPFTGRLLLFVNPGYTTRIVELSPRESGGLLRLLFDHINDPAFHYKHKWAEGDVVIWDEHQTTHMGPSDFAPAHRRLARVTAGRRAPVTAS